MNISPVLQRTLSRSALKISKHSPTILTVVGIAGLLTAGVIAAKQTLKLEATLDNSNARLENVKHHVEEGDATQRDVNKAVIANSVDLVKLYWLPVTLGIASGTVILVGHSILHKRNLALVGAYATLQEAYNNYRQRVVEEYGAEVDEKFRYGIRDVVEIDDNGKKTKTQVIEPTFDYVFRFDSENDNWNGTHEHNLFFVTRFQQVFNDKLQAHGHVILHEVLDALGLPRTKASLVTGWVWKNPTGVSDGYIDFGIKDFQSTQGYILLDFNVDGLITELI